jgi:hypothetical protein
MDLIFDPLQRPARRYVGIEITGHSWSGSLYWRDALDPLLSFVERNARFDKQLLLFADVDPSEQRGLREYCAEAGIVMFEDESEIRDLDESTIRARGRPAVPDRRATGAVRATGREERRRSKRRWFRRD